MKAIVSRLRRLENAAAPAERERAAVEAILTARRRRIGADYEPRTFPPNSFAGCRTIADRILRSRKLRMEREQNGVRDRPHGLSAKEMETFEKERLQSSCRIDPWQPKIEMFLSTRTLKLRTGS